MEIIERIKEVDIRKIIEAETNQKFNSHNFLGECPFCKSGTGKNRSSAFSVNLEGNYYKCFSCDSKGTCIDFMLHRRQDWKERNAIKYLAEKYLSVDSTAHHKNNLNQFDKTLYAIKSNNNLKAQQYLESRHINTRILPKNSYYYDSLLNAVVFLDSEQRLINRRLITPEDGKPKALNKGVLNGSLYTKLFKPELETVYIHEGVINALSMSEYSLIALFSSENKIEKKDILLPYIKGKHVILAFDNDSSGNKCTAHYTNFLVSNRFDILSVQQLTWPEENDANDLLEAGKLKSFLSNSCNYKMLWEDVSRKPIIPDSENKKEANHENYFYKEDGCYYVQDIVRGKPTIKKLSNFVMEILFHLIDGSKDTSRIIKFQRNTGEIVVKELLSSELNLDKFKKIIRSISGRGLSYFGNTTQLEYILAHLQDFEEHAKAINQLGYQIESQTYAFADAIITRDNKLFYIDKLGVVKVNNKTFYLAPFSETNLKNIAYNDQRRFSYQEGELSFKDWASLIYMAYGINGTIGISFIVLALFRDFIINLTGFFPFLFLFGDQGAGKSNFINFFLHLFGEPGNGISLLNSTDKGFSRSLTQRKNALYYLKEYTNSIDKKTVDIFKTGYDGELYTMAQKSNDNKTITHEITSACMVDGNELPTSEAALFARMIVLNFEENHFTQSSTDAYKKLLKNKDKGFCQVTRELLKSRPYFEKEFKPLYETIFHELKQDLKKDIEITDRQLRHIALILAPVKLLKDRLSFPFKYDNFLQAVIANAQTQSELSNDIKDVNIFWNAISFKRNETYSEIKEGVQYTIDYSKEILFLKYKQLYPFYVEYAKKNNMRILGEHSLKELLTSKGNKAFIPNTTQKARGDKAYTKKNFGSCYMFRFEKTDNGSTILINGIEFRP